VYIQSNNDETNYCCTKYDPTSGGCLDASFVCHDTKSKNTGDDDCLKPQNFPTCSGGGPTPPAGVKPQFFGNWYYGVGSVCNNNAAADPTYGPTADQVKSLQSLTAGPACTITFDSYIDAVNKNKDQIARNKLIKQTAKRNSYFYLGTGYYEASWTAKSTYNGGGVSWTNFDCDGDTTASPITATSTELQNMYVPTSSDGMAYGWQVLNFGGWGCCGQDTGKGCGAPMGTSAPAAPWTPVQPAPKGWLWPWMEGDEVGSIAGYQTYCNSDGLDSCANCHYVDLDGPGGISTNVAAVAPSSTGPNAVWNNDVINWFIKNISADDIKKRGYTAVSFDIEGVQQGDPGQLHGFGTLLAMYRKAGLKTIVTVPGNGVSGVGAVNTTPDHGGMGWLDAAKDNIDYMCLMYYALIGDTTCSIGGGSIADMSNSLYHNWTGPAPRYGKWKPDQIIMGLTFGIGGETVAQKQITDLFGVNGIWGTEEGKAFGGVTRWAEKGGTIHWGPGGGKPSTKQGLSCAGAPKPPPPQHNCEYSFNTCCTGGKNCSVEHTCKLVCGDKTGATDCSTCTSCGATATGPVGCKLYPDSVAEQPTYYHSALGY